MDGEDLYYSGRVLWVVKSRGGLYGKVIDDYPYFVEIKLNSDENVCTCPKGGSCEHVHAVKLAYERGFYFDCPNAEAFGEACALSMLDSVPALALDVVIKELRHSLETDESGSQSAKLLYRSFKLIERVQDTRKIKVLEALLDEYSKVFPDYTLTERLKSEFRRLKIRLESGS